MDLNDIQLPASVIAELYRSYLIETADSSPAKLQPELKTANNENVNNSPGVLGENKKNITIIVHSSNAEILPERELSFLINMLGACKLTLDDAVIINLNNYTGISYKEIINQYKSKTVFLFGPDPSMISLPLNFPHFQVQPFTGTSYLYAPALNELEEDKVLKSKLWVCLKRIFEV